LIPGVRRKRYGKRSGNRAVPAYATGVRERIFLLSPARCSGERANLIYSERAQFPLALRLRSGEANLGETFSFLSGLYFRGKLSYAQRFASPDCVWIMTTNHGLLPPHAPMSLKTLRRMATVPIALDEPRYTRPLKRCARQLAQEASDAEIILLGSVASGKYVDLLLNIFGERLKFPSEFVGRGDMSRGGLMLRAVDSGQELQYISVAGAIRHGKRPPRLEPINRNAAKLQIANRKSQIPPSSSDPAAISDSCI
jgi:hypothetical protein